MDGGSKTVTILEPARQFPCATLAAGSGGNLQDGTSAALWTAAFRTELVFLSADRGAGVRQALEEGIGVMQRNPNMTTREKFGAVKTLEDALDTLDRVRAAMPGR